jgi:GNAT superfamily N-acetyltransferase
LSGGIEALGGEKFSLAVWNILAKLVSPLGRLSVELLLRRDLKGPIPPISANVEVTIRPTAEGELDRVARLYSRDPYLYLGDAPSAALNADTSESDPNALELYRERMRRGEKCFLALVGSEIAHVNWTCFQWGEAIAGRPLVLRAGQVYTTDAFTVEKYRGQNIHAAVLGEMLRYAQRAGCHTAYTVTRQDRRRSFRAFRQLGWHVIGRLLCFTPRWAETSWILRVSGCTDGFFR